MAELVFDRVAKRFGRGGAAVEDLSLRVGDGEFFVLVGPSGCGKSTALRMVAGLEDPSSGVIYIGGRAVNDVPPKGRDVAMVFQDYALYPHMTSYQNIAFALELRRLPRAEIARRVRAAAAALEIEPLLERKPKDLSGGQRQRVAIGRAMVREPAAFLMDEPLSNLDARLRSSMRGELKRLHRRLGTTTLYVTHDQTEAMTLADRVAVLSAGRLQQCAAPAEVYAAPANAFVASFFGSPPMNLVRGELARGPGGAVVRGPGFALEAPARAPAAPRPVTLGVRPERLRPAPRDAPFGVEGRLDFVESNGPESFWHVATEAGAVVARAGEGPAPRPGDAVRLAAAAADVHLFDAATGERLGAAP
ncbi:MAG TPA: sn-glycerol-3-phosphate ABC transporter ATP-binding protein UgpC [Polyangiaceae bacterium]|nr:sn-glycerol-3-phosphate ABC transporter ATP-binding protein UgpC [Polyangiaceae bacterium]